MGSYILVLGAEDCPNCPVAKMWCEKIARVLGIGFRYADVEKDEEARKMYMEAVERGYLGVPQIYLVCRGVPYFITNGLPDTVEDLVRIFSEMVRYYGIDLKRCAEA